MTESVIVNDPNGLCLTATGDMNQRTSGVYTSLWKLASQLSGPVKRVVIETKTGIIHLKEYEGHAVAMKVPIKQDENEGEEEPEVASS